MTKYTEAQARAIKQYMQEKVENIQLRVPKGKKEKIKAASIRAGISMNQFIIQAIDHEIAAVASDESNVTAADRECNYSTPE